MPEETSQANPADRRLDAASFYVGGSIAERIDLQLGVLTQGVIECMILSTGACPGLTEPGVAQPHPLQRVAASMQSTWQAARSAELRDAARLSEASARLVLGLAKLRGEFKQGFTIKHSHDSKQGHTILTKKFSVPEAVAGAPSATDDTKQDAEFTANLRKVVEAMASKAPPPAAQDAAGDDPIAALKRHLRGENKDDSTPQGAS